LWQGPRLAVNDRIQLALGQAGYFLGNFSEAQKYLQQASNSGQKEIKGQAYVWLALVHEKNGQTEEVEKLINQAKSFIPEFAQQYPALKEIPVL